MKRIGITGGIGSGKSFVCSIFLDYNFKIFNSDYEAKKIINNNQKIKKLITNQFGDLSYINGKINTSYISDIVFTENKKLGQINKIIHPEVFISYQNFLIKNKNFNTVYESALLFDYENFKINDYNILITCPKKLRIKRIITRDNIKHEDVEKKINSQIDYDKKKYLADFHIQNIEMLSTKKIVIEFIEKFF
jgi:dephospho-CoA kinase|tara:strand:- start:212 stop:787 length:576 start_codon:yes stop_codon:yes gene_type:complete